MATIQTKSYSLKGGLDLVSDQLEVSPGKAFLMENFEPWFNGGYRRISGYEAFDGRPKPSAAIFHGFDLDDVTGLTVGTTLTGDTSAETCVVIGISGNSIGVTKLSGTLTQGEDFNTGAYTMSASPSVVQGQSPSDEITRAWRLAAENEYRGDIAAPAGAGEVLGVWQLNSDVYCVRDNVDGTAGILFRATTAGWVTTGISMAHYQYFDAGTANGPFVEGDTVTDTVSGETGTVHRVVLHAGAWDGSAEGYIVITGLTGPMADNSTLQVGGSTVATGVGASAQFAFSPDGNYQFTNHNFYAGSGTYRVYGCNGVDPAFEIDENRVVSPILFPNTAVANQPSTNVPFLIEEHRNHLFIAIPGGRVQGSVQGEPLTFNGFLGAADFGVGHEVTGLTSIVGNVLVIKTDRETRGLYGTNILDWEMKLVGDKTGGQLFSSQKMDTVYGFDYIGVTSLARTDEFGDFTASTMSQLVDPFVVSHRELFNTSTVVRKSNQYRLYFSDKTALVMFLPLGSTYMSQKGMESRDGHFSILSYDHEVKRIYNTEDENGVERTYFASDDGFVYEDNIGRNFNGEPIRAFCRLAFHHMGSPGWRKRFRRLKMEVAASETTTLQFLSDVDYGSTEIPLTSTEVQGGGSYWNADNWDQLVFDGKAVAEAITKLKGFGENLGLLIYSDSAVTKPFALQACTFHFERTRLER